METSLPGASPLQALSADLAGIVERAGRSFVAVHGRRRLPSSGVVWRRGIVVTAAHTLRRDEGISVTVANGRSIAAVLAGRDAGTTRRNSTCRRSWASWARRAALKR
jgi:serine protease Do